jgi:hypothetical protein
MTKPYHEMTPAERLSARIAKNREIDQRVQDKKPADAAAPSVKAAPGARAAAGRKRGEIGINAKPARNALDKFQEIKRTQGIDAAADFVHSRIKTAVD